MEGVTKRIFEHEITEFMVGNYGDFDHLCASVLKEMKKDFPHIKILLIPKGCI